MFRVKGLSRRPAGWIAGLTISVSAVAEAYGEIVARDDFQNSLHRVSVQQIPAIGTFLSADDAFQIYQVDVGTIPRQFLDTSVTTTDALGVIDATTKKDPWFGVSDVRNPENPTGNGQVTWQFDVTGFRDLSFSIDLAAMGDFEETDTYNWSYSWNGQDYVSLLESSLDTTSPYEYTLLDGTKVKLADPIRYGTTVVSNHWSTFHTTITGTGSRLWIQFKTVADGGTEVYALDSLVIEGTASSPVGKQCDVNGDLAVDALDMSILFGNWEGPGTGDLTLDGVVDAADAAICFAEWTGDASPDHVQAVPEPHALGWSSSASLLTWLVARAGHLRRAS